jgi:hypothetical protein
MQPKHEALSQPALQHLMPFCHPLQHCLVQLPWTSSLQLFLSAGLGMKLTHHISCGCYSCRPPPPKVFRRRPGMPGLQEVSARHMPLYILALLSVSAIHPCTTVSSHASLHCCLCQPGKQCYARASMAAFKKGWAASFHALIQILARSPERAQCVCRALSSQLHAESA